MYYVNCARHRPLKRNHLQRYICSLKKLAHNCFFLQRNFDNLVKCEHKERGRKRENGDGSAIATYLCGYMYVLGFYEIGKYV